MKYSFTTLSTPAWNLTKICQFAEKSGYQGIDFRGYLDYLDISTHPLFTTQAQNTFQQLTDAGLEVSGISSSITICDQSVRENNVEEAKRTIEVAKSFHCKNIRIFGGGDSECFSRSELINIGRDCFENIVSLDGANDLYWLLETHDQWTKTSDCQKIIKNIHQPSFGILWDIGHTTRVSQEKPTQTLKRLGDNFKYIHIKDAIYNPNHPLAMDDGWYYVLPGEGQLPISSALKLLNDIDYSGWIVFEHEKRWHPELAEPVDALPAFINWLKNIGF